MLYTRRDIAKLAAALPLASRLGAKPDSRFGGVQVGAISYSFREMPDGNDAQAILSHMVNLGLSGIELMNGPAEAWAGRRPGQAAESRVGPPGLRRQRPRRPVSLQAAEPAAADAEGAPARR